MAGMQRVLAIFVYRIAALKGQQSVIVAKNIAIFQSGSAFQQKIVADNLCLLLNAILSERFSGLQFIVITREGISRQRQEHALLMLPDMHHLVNEQRLDIACRSAEIIAEQIAFGMKPEIAIRCHGYPPVLKQPPFAIENGYLIIVDGLSENGRA